MYLPSIKLPFLFSKLSLNIAVLYKLNLESNFKDSAFVAIPESFLTQFPLLLINTITWSINSTPPKLI